MKQHLDSKSENKSSPQNQSCVNAAQDKEQSMFHKEQKQNGSDAGFDFSKTAILSKTTPNDDLPRALQVNMESAFGQDFSGVGIHRNSKQAQRLNALAYTQGESIHFAPGEFNPHSESGRNLIGHEFAHVVQQRSGVVQPTAVLGKGMVLNDNRGLENEADSLGNKAVQGEAVAKYQSPSLGMRSELRTVQAKSNVIQRDIKDSKDLNNGKIELDFKKNDATKAGIYAREVGYVKFHPSTKTPLTNSIKFVQIVRTFDTSTGADYDWTGRSEANRKEMTTSQDTKKNITEGFYVDQIAGSLNPRKSKADPTVAPYYDVTGPPDAQNQTGSKTAKTSTSALLYDAPGFSRPLKYNFVTSAKATDTDTWLGSVLWGFEVYLDKGIAKIKDEYGSFREVRGETTDAALKKFNEFYKNPGTSKAPTK